MNKIKLFLLSLIAFTTCLYSSDTAYVSITFSIDTSNHIDIASPTINLSLNNTSSGSGVSEDSTPYLFTNNSGQPHKITAQIINNLPQGVHLTFNLTPDGNGKTRGPTDISTIPQDLLTDIEPGIASGTMFVSIEVDTKNMASGDYSLTLIMQMLPQ